MNKKLLLIAFTALFLTANAAEVLAESNQSLSSRLEYLEAKFKTLEEEKKYQSPILETALKNAKIFGRLQVDANWYNEDRATDNKSDGIDIVRARLGIGGKISNNLNYKFENDFSDNASEIKDAYLAYTGIENAEIVFGQTKPTLSLEILESSNHMLFIQRSLAEDSVLGRLVGLKGSKYDKNWRIAAGIFGESVGNEERDDDSRYSFTARATVAPINSEDALLHIGTATSYTSRNRRDGVSADDNLDKEHLIAAELIARYKAFTLQGEYIANHTDYDQDSGSGDSVDFSSYYVQASFALTGEHRKYSDKHAKLGKLKVKNSAGKSGIGAVELAARFSHLDRNDESIIDGESDNYSAGVNWYPNDALRFMLNYVRSNTSYAHSKSSEGYNSASLRTIMYF
ncbi:MAG: phosphate-selective porin OprO/OprP [Rickettsiales bacterium]|jgi:phosphate-selective porin OprO/OprP